MSHTASTSSFSATHPATAPPCFSTLELRRFYDERMLDSQIKQFTAQTLYCRKDIFSKFFWFVDHRKYLEVGAPEIKAFLGYLANGHTEAGGRWGNARLTGAMKPVTMLSYYRTLHAFFNWMVEEEIVADSLMARVKAPVYRPEVKQPLTRDVVLALLEAGKQSQSPQRNEAILLVLLDTGNIDLTQRTLRSCLRIHFGANLLSIMRVMAR